MAYRVKGILTKKQREQLTEVIEAYHELVTSNEILEGLNSILQLIGINWIAFARFVLYIDDCTIIKKTITKQSG